MRHNSLNDLNMAGVRWELAENPTKFSEKNISQKQQIITNHTVLKPMIVPASAPITLDTVKSMVERPTDISSLIRMIAEFNHPLRSGATNVVLPNIATKPNGLVIVTDIPSQEDDLSGKILSGLAGELIDKMLSAIEMSRESVSIVPLLFWRTPGGRSPSREELDLIRPFVDKMLDMLNPNIILTLGTLAATEIGNVNLSEIHGTEIQDEKERKIFPIYHPNYLMLKPSAKRDVWDVLQNIQKLLKNR